VTALTRHLPALAARLPSVPLGDWPTPLREHVLDGRSIWVKDEGASSPLYGGNKIRTLEQWFGHARARGAKRIWAIGAVGSNHVIATAIHAPRAGLEAGAILFPQPASEWSTENGSAIERTGVPIVRLRSVIEVPFAGVWIAARHRRDVVMPPGGATPVGTFGAVGAAFELAEQVQAGLAPPPRRIIVPIGSTCTASGLLAGVHLARATGAWPWPLPVIHGVRVTPWPVTAAFRITGLAARTLDRAAALGGPRLGLTARELGHSFVLDGRELGEGYGISTPAGDAAVQAIGGGPRLDGVYSAKAASALLRLHRAGIGPMIFWSTKSAIRL
jgi:D-cysteine desulfhydrase